MVICRVQMQKFLPQHVQEIVGYAVKHGYKDIVADAAPLLLAMPLEETVARLPVNIVAPWALYYGAWNRVLRSARSFPLQPRISILRSGGHVPDVPDSGRNNQVSCGCNVNKQICDILMALHDVDSLQNLATVFTLTTTRCKNVTSSLNKWRQAIETEIGNIKPSITYL
ncbi:hypothetical protein BDZ94DRAFT_1270472 [Collybia nuda]|uniref:Uncharacterized protein n=1 Tax=Collybia nuda TaxID=64659 RepID=A0A9P5XZI5_9AGAR|nr:hypothetical protein BDZ94DRAFT_1270472 [Collybia nuda]